jgi:hypothetical protein
MKKLLLFLLIALCASCTKVEVEVDPDPDPEQDYTSFTFAYHGAVVFPECVVGYYKDGLYIKIAELGELSKDKVSPEIIVEDPNIVDIYFFTDYLPYRLDGRFMVKQLDATYTLRANMKNNFTIEQGTRGIEVNKYDATQYPH